MPYAFNLTLDPDASLEIERVYARLADFDVPDHDLVTQYGPCVTLLIVSDAIHGSRLTDMMKQLLPAMEALPASLTRPCIIAGLPPTLSLRIAPTDGLLGLHHAIYSGLPEEEVHLHYRPAYWQPHLKLSNFRGDRRAGDTLVAALAQEWRPTSGMLDRFELIQYMPVQSIWQAPLRSPSSRAPAHGRRLSGQGESL